MDDLVLELDVKACTDEPVGAMVMTLNQVLDEFEEALRAGPPAAWRATLWAYQADHPELEAELQ